MDIKAFFTPERKRLISIKEVESMAGLPVGTLAKFLAGKRDLPAKHIDKIVEVLKLLGY